MAPDRTAPDRTAPDRTAPDRHIDDDIDDGDIDDGDENDPYWPFFRDMDLGIEACTPERRAATAHTLLRGADERISKNMFRVDADDVAVSAHLLCCPDCGRPIASATWSPEGTSRIHVHVEDSTTERSTATFTRYGDDGEWRARLVLESSEDDAITQLVASCKDFAFLTDARATLHELDVRKCARMTLEEGRVAVLEALKALGWWRL